jgi:hypothetical protein
VKVGNRQAPHSLQSIAASPKPHPTKVGFLRFGLHPSKPRSEHPSITRFRLLQHAKIVL